MIGPIRGRSELPGRERGHLGVLSQIEGVAGLVARSSGRALTEIPFRAGGSLDSNDTSNAKDQQEFGRGSGRVRSTGPLAGPALGRDMTLESSYAPLSSLASSTSCAWVSAKTGALLFEAELTNIGQTLQAGISISATELRRSTARDVPSVVAGGPSLVRIRPPSAQSTNPNKDNRNCPTKQPILNRGTLHAGRTE